MKFGFLVAGFASILSVALLAADADSPVKQLSPEQINPGETKDQRDARMAWWRDARFGMFIHWGLYSVAAGQWNGKSVPGFGEWIMRHGSIPVKDYRALAEKFNPTAFNAEDWVAVAKAAGMKYLIFTAKHHDGFAMFKSAYPFNIVDTTPFKRDPLKELTAACQREGIKLGFYYSQDLDWTAPGAAGNKWDPAQEGNFADYLHAKAIPQLKELLTNYQPAPAIIWFDIPSAEMTPELAGEVLALLREHPNLIRNNRLGGDDLGDTETPEQQIPLSAFLGRDWESCMTTNNTWGYRSDDQQWVSVDGLILNLVDIASKGGNCLLNVGPTGEGLIPEPAVERLKGVGAWLKVNGESIYGTEASPFRREPSWGRITRKKDRLYLHIMNRPENGKLVLPMRNAIGKAYFLASPEMTLGVSSGPDGVVIELPANYPMPFMTVVAVDVKGAIDPLPSPAVEQKADGSILLTAREADRNSSGSEPPRIMLEGPPGNPNIGNWRHPEDFVQWTISVTQPGNFEVAFDYAIAPFPEEARFGLKVGDQILKGTLPPTAEDGRQFEKHKMGMIAVPQAGIVTVTLQPDGPNFGKLISVTLTPAP